MQIDFKPTPKQFEMFETFDDTDTTQILYGGAASSGKSYGLMAMATIKSLQYPGIRILIGREELKNLKATTLKSLWKVFADFGIIKDKHFKFNQIDSELTFWNGSTLILRQLKHEPSDPEVDSLGSLELTFAIIDEVPQVVQKVVEVLHSRCGRWLNDKYNIKPMLYMTCNPARGFVYNEFYKPSIKGNLKKTRKFIPATIDDNPHMSETYKKHLEDTLSFNDKQRLRYGKWEFDNDPNALVKFKNINGAYDYDKPKEANGTPYLTCDIAFTSDKCIIIRWSGFDVMEIIDIDKENDRPEDVIRDLKAKHNIQNSNVCYDATGAGLYLKNYLPNAYIFHSGAKALKGEKFEHLKTQMYFKLAEEIMKDNSRLRIFDSSFREELIDEVMQIKILPKEKLDAVVKMIKKDDIKKVIGRSPDILDALAMRFVYDIKTSYKRNF